MDPITAAIIVLGVNFVAGAVNKSAATKMEEYRKEAQKKAQNKMLELSGLLYQERLKLDREMHRNLLEQQRKSNTENLNIIAEQIEAYTKWPLNVSPIALRGSSSLLPEEMIDVAERQPCYLLVAPGSDKELNKSLDELQEHIFSYTSNYLTAARGHNVVLLKDCWANTLKECGEIEARNIHSFIKDVPMIVLSPSHSMPGEVCFNLSMWNMFDRNSEHKLSYSFGETLRMKNGNDIKLIANDLCAFFTYISDCYAWVHYREVPQLMMLACSGALNLSDEVFDSYYDQYVKLLREMTDNGLLSKLDESEAILNYCRAVDGPLHAQQAFAAAGYIGEDADSAMLSLPQPVQALVWKYIGQNPDVCRLLPVDSFRKLQCECLRCNWLKALDNSFNSHVRSSDMFRQLVDKYKPKIVAIGAEIKKHGLDRMRAVTDMVDLRDKLRPILIQNGERRIKSEIFPLLVDDLVPFIRKSHKVYINKQILESAGNLNHCLLDADDFSEVGLRIATDIHDKFVKSLSKTRAKEIAEKEYVYFSMYSWADKIANDWIVYVFLSHDIVHSDIGYVTSKAEDKMFYDAVLSSMEYRLCSIAKKMLGIEDSYSSSSYDSDSSDDSFFNNVVMSPSF